MSQFTTKPLRLSRPASAGVFVISTNINTVISPEQATRQWVKEFVVALNLCPFAAPVLRGERLRITATEADRDQAIFSAMLTELEFLYQADADELHTSLLVFSHALHDFNDYLDVADIASDLVVEAGLEGIIQVATFHPDYCFEGVPATDASNFSNRSPYPMLHFIREEQMERALASYPEPEKIPDNNIRRLQAMGVSEIRALNRKLLGNHS